MRDHVGRLDERRGEKQRAAAIALGGREERRRRRGLGAQVAIGSGTVVQHGGDRLLHRRLAEL